MTCATGEDVPADRLGEDGVSHQHGGQRANWVRADLVEGRLTCFVSPDGNRWTPIDQRPTERIGPAHAGLAVCSVVPGRPCKATFEDAAVVELDRTADE